MNPDDITLESTAKLFAYEKYSRELDSINNIDEVRNVAKTFIKLYMKQQETLSQLFPNG